MQPFDGSQTPLALVMCRFHLDILYLKIVCLLHRKYLPRARHNPRYAHYRRQAIEASLEMLRHLATFQRESRPGGYLHSVPWFLTSLATKDFFLPSMLIVSDLHHDNLGQGAERPDDAQGQSFWTRDQRQEMISILELTRDVWKGLAHGSMEAVKASKILEIMLAKITGSGGADGPAKTYETPARPGHAKPEVPADVRPERLAVTSSGMPPTEALSGSAAASNETHTSLGTTYGSWCPGLETSAAVPNLAGAEFGNNISMGGATTPEFPNNPLLGFDGVQSPLSVFDTMAGSNMDISGSFDWVRLLISRPDLSAC
jgi:hypothetical protein